MSEAFNASEGLHGDDMIARFTPELKRDEQAAAPETSLGRVQRGSKDEVSRPRRSSKGRMSMGDTSMSEQSIVAAETVQTHWRKRKSSGERRFSAVARDTPRV